MKMLIKEFADFTGVSVRTLHYYDEIGLLNPAFVDEQNGYRFYDEASVERMQEILFYRELDFSLKSICEILASPDYDKQKALAEQKKLLILRKERLERIISALDSAEKGEIIMKVFDKSEYETACKQYEAEAKEKWGRTDAYKEHAEKTKDYSKEKWQSLAYDMEHIFKEFAVCMQNGEEADSPDVQALVKKLQNHITENYYTCSNQILAGLGQMYAADERFKRNIDKYADGTAEYVREAISKYL